MAAVYLQSNYQDVVAVNVSLIDKEAADIGNVKLLDGFTNWTTSRK